MLKAAIVGLGWWGKIIVQTMDGNEKLQIVAATDLDPAAAAFAVEHRLRFLPNFAAILADPAIEAVILCTPHTQHAAQVVAVANAGKHCFCEKPLCLTRADAAAAIDACRAHNVTLGVGHERRFEPPMQALRELVNAGALGTLLQIEANFSQDKMIGLAADNWRLSGREAPAGPMTATGVHLLDLCVSFLGPAEQVLAQVKQLGSNLVNGDTLGILVRFRSGANALISAILATPFDGRFAIYGNKGWAEIRDLTHPEAPEGWTLTIQMQGAKRTVQTFEPASSVRRNLEAFAAAAAGEAPYPMTHEQMLGTISALEAIFRSATSGKIEAVA